MIQWSHHVFWKACEIMMATGILVSMHDDDLTQVDDDMIQIENSLINDDVTQMDNVHG